MVIKMILGESRQFDFEIKSKRDKNAIFYIRDASYELILDGIQEDSGTCTINDHIITATISPKQRSNNYFLLITYKVADNIMKDRYRVEVV